MPEVTASPAQPRLLDQVSDAIRRRHYSYRTEESYIRWIKRFVLFSGKRHPRELGAPEVTAVHRASPAIVASPSRRPTRT